MRRFCLVIAVLVLADCQAADKSGAATITSIASEPQLLTDQARVVSGYCGRGLFELRARPGTYYNTPAGRVDVDPLVTIRIGSTTRQYDKSVPFVTEMFRPGAPTYKFQMTCYSGEANVSEVQVHAYGVSYSGSQPVFSNVMLVFSYRGAVLNYDNRPVSYDYLHNFLP